MSTSVMALQGSLFETGHEVAGRRIMLDQHAWVDVVPGWFTQADPAYAALMREVPWRAERRQMWDTVVDVPRLIAFYGERDPLPHDSLSDAREALNRRYATCLPEGFATAGMCLYRDGRDSVAWHGDRIGRSRNQDTLIAIISLGSRRDLMLRPRGGGTSQRFQLGHGDLVVMGGACQRTWDHCIPKTAVSVGPRISVQFRPYGVM